MSEAPNSGAKRYLTNTASCVIYRVLQMSVLVWVNQYLLKRISPEEYSLYPLVLSLVVFANFFRSIFTGGIARFLVAAHARGDKEETTRISSSMFPVLAGAGLVIFLAGALVAWRVQDVLEIEPGYVGQARVMLLMLAATMCWNVATTPFQAGLYVRQEFVSINLIELAAEILRVALLLTLLFGVSTRVMWLVVASSAATVVSTVCQIAMTRRRLPEIRFDRRMVSMDQVKILMSFSAWSCTEMYSGLAAKSLPFLFLNRFSGPLAVAHYHLANLVDTQAKSMLVAAMRPAQPALTAMHATGKGDKLKELYYSGGRYHLWVMLLIAGPVMAFGPELMSLYAGDAYREAGYVMMAFFLRYPFLYASAMYYRIAHAAGNIRAYYISDALLQTCIIIAMYIVLRYGGGNAVAAAWCACIAQSVFHLLVIWPLGLRFVNGSWTEFGRKTLLPGLLPFALSVAICFVLKGVLPLGNWSGVIGGFALGAAVSLVGILLIGSRTSDRDFLRKVLAKFQRKALPTPQRP